MPRLHRLAARTPVNVYDALRPLVPPYVDGSCRLFGSAHVGDIRWTNLQVPALPVIDDLTFYIVNRYARTNIPAWEDSPAMLAWASSAVASLVIGDRNIISMAVVDLLRRRPLEVQRLTTCVYCQNDLSADVMKQHKEAGLPLIIAPARQTVYIVVESDRDAGQIFKAACRNMDIAPEPAVWFHLEGYKSRDVC